MLFSSLTFLFIFLPCLLIAYFIFKNIKIRNIILLIFSLVFYSWGEPKYIFLMLLVVFISYIFGLLIDRYKKHKKILLIFSLISILSFLIYFKYFNFIIENINLIFKSDINSFNIILPIGISFYTFQILSYLADLYWGKIYVQKNIFSLALYVSLFPQLIAGPIVRYETVEDELSNRKETLNDFIIGLKRFIIGLSKKVIIANQMAIIADSIFNSTDLSSYGSLIMVTASLAYTFQIYFDFSGYSDMAIGLGRMFGFHFLENFNFPYNTRSITDFWRRWHMSLSSWFRDYVYIPLGGNRVSKIRWIFNIFIVWGLTGLWHGASWNFIIWGLYFAVILLLEKLFLSKYLEKTIPIFQWLYSFVLIVIGWIIFRSNSTSDIFIVLKNMFLFKNSAITDLIDVNPQILISLPLFIPAIIFSFPIKVKSIRLLENILLLILFGICIVLLVSSSYNPFIYFRF